MLSFTWKEGWGREATRRVELEGWNEGKGGGADAVNVWMEGWNGSRGGGREGGGGEDGGMVEGQTEEGIEKIRGD